MLLTDAFLEFRLAKDHSPASQRWYKERLGAFFDWAGAQGVESIEGVTAPLVRRYVEHLKTRGLEGNWPERRPNLSSHTVHGHVRAIRAFLNFLVNEDLVDSKLPKRIALPVKEQYVIATFMPDHLNRLLKEAGKTSRPLRDTAILSVLMDTGIRAAELCNLTLDRLTLNADEAFIVVRGKGRKDRRCQMGKKASMALARYLHRERQGDSIYVFLSRAGTPIRPEGLYRLLYRLRDAAGREHFAGVRVSCHTFRHSMAVSWLEQGGDIYRLSRNMGHSSVTTTEMYAKTFAARDGRGMSVLDTLQQKGR